jgi:ADP-heptose:LPS heptosyltransferase
MKRTLCSSAILIMSSSLGDFIATLGFIQDLSDIYNELTILELTRVGSIGPKVLGRDTNIKTISIDISCGLIACLKQLLTFDVSTVKSDIYMVHPTRIRALRLLGYCILGLFLTRLNGTIKFPRQTGIPDRRFRSDSVPITNRSVIGYKMYSLQKRVSRSKILNMLAIDHVNSSYSRISSSIFYNPKRVIAVFPGGKDARKRWGMDNWVYIIQRIVENSPYTILLIGGAEDLHYNKAFEVKLRNLCSDISLVNVTGMLSVRDTIRVLGRCYSYIGSDSAPAHMSALAGCKCLIVFCNYDNLGLWEPITATQLICHRPTMLCGKREGDDYGIKNIDRENVLMSTFSLLDDDRQATHEAVLESHNPPLVLKLESSFE